MPGTARSAESLLGQLLAMLRNVRSPKMRKAGMFSALGFGQSPGTQRLLQASLPLGRKHPPNRLWQPALRRGYGVRNLVRFLLRLAEAAGAAASLMTKRWAWLSLKLSPAGKMLTLR